ncbi:hypothetical protein COV23_00640 [Candidatus Wolfebacteria bacterium CG10_big_fil_rev_8_21_14_0_10_31_9]|uniref:Solute-binding protein family 5 domain-containing protein n=1 Tax=Candidatus Wolfebacteria bacterium CG10_big_fil_rev_8_21_14_0_10_31_9 TaxID=1975070 RepID=A0A2H0RCM2_9BACT|nr:MAG: hypothetical protein COV23_00640 [Candidatus Wolfebacteria bacterium CG10_big_fil_rev_8_21_14_0_10_31_9]
MFSIKERFIFLSATLVFIISSIILSTIFVQKNTILSPTKGGEYTEGIVDQPSFINPVLAQINSIDKDISELVFATLKDMSDDITPNDDKKTYTVRIKGDIFWQDKTPITSDDVIFTIKAIQDPDINSPLAPNWKGVRTERISERELKIIIPATYSYFENILANLRPLPKHLFENIPLANIKLSSYSLEPIGSGPFKFSSFEKTRDGFISTYSLSDNKDGFTGAPFLKSFTIKMYKNKTALIDAFNSGDIDGMAITDPSDISKISIPNQLFKIQMPRYYAIFLNIYKNKSLKNIEVKTALNFATDKNKIIKDVFNDLAFPINGPAILSPESNDFSIDRANEILSNAGWTLNDENIRVSNNGSQKLEFSITVFPSSTLIKTAEIIKEDWAKIGVKININTPPIDNFSEDIIKTRNYEMLLFGNIYGENMDTYSFWHSSQKFYPGLNLSLYENKNADYLIEQIRSTFNKDTREKELDQLQSTIINDSPAVFLYSPYYLYITNKSLKGFNEEQLSLPSDRFLNAKTWYIKTVRSFK